MARRKRTAERAEQIRHESALDPFRDFQGSKTELILAKFFFFLRSHLRETLYGLGALVIVGALAVSWLVWDNMRRERSLAAFEDLLREPIMTPGSGAEKAALDKLDAYEKKYSDKGAQLRAELHRLEILNSSLKIEESAKVSERIAEEVSAPEMKALFYYRAGILYEKAKNWAAGAQAFGRAADHISDWNAQKAQALFGKVRCLQESGKDQEAKDTARKLLEAKEGEGLDEVKLAVTAHMLSRSR